MASKYGVYNATLTGDWARLGVALSNLSVRFPQAMEQALHEEGEFYRRKMVEGIREQAPGGQAFKPLSPVTIALRKLAGFSGSKALIRTGELRNNIVSVPGKGFVFVGILYTARGEDGRNLAEIGRLNEYGGTVRTTISRQRMRMIAMAMKRSGGGGRGKGGGGLGIGFVQIPARPFIRPVIEMYGQRRGAERYMARVARKVGGLLGVINHPDLGGFGVERLPERLAAGRAGGFAKGMRSMRRGGLGQGMKKGQVGFKQALGKSFSKVGAGRGIRVARPPRAPRKPRIIRPRPPRPKAAPKTRAKAPPKPKRSVTGRPFKPIKPPKPPKQPGQRAPRRRKNEPAFAHVERMFAKGRRNIAKQKAAEAKRLEGEKVKIEKSAKRAADRAQRDMERAQKQALKDYLRANPQHNAHVKHRQMRINLGHLNE